MIGGGKGTFYMRTWEENCNRINAFYKSDYYQFLKAEHPGYIRSVCNSLMEDPDECDSDLYVKKAQELADLQLSCKRTSCVNNDGTVFGMDCVIGWKRLFDLHEGNIQWIDDYAVIRSNLSAHWLWPRCGNNTINIVRARVFNDRADYTLFDIQQYYKAYPDISSCRMIAAFANPVTNRWLQQFDSFRSFVQNMRLQMFCTDAYDVINLSNTDEVLKSYKKKYEVDIVYLQNLKAVLLNHYSNWGYF